MKLISYLHGGAPHWGCVTGDGIVDLGRRLPGIASVAALLEGGEAAMAQARAAAEGAAPDHALADVQVALPIARPRRIFCIGVNYAHRNAEYKDGSELPKYPSLFMRVPSRSSGHGAAAAATARIGATRLRGRDRASSSAAGRRIAAATRRSPASPA